MIDVARFQSNEKPWSDNVLPTDWEVEWRKRLRLIRGPVHVKRQGEPQGPPRTKAEGIDIVVREMMTSGPRFQIALVNDRGKVVRARVLESANPFGPIMGPSPACVDDWSNIRVAHNKLGELVKLQEPALESYLEAERIYGKPIKLTGYPFGGWRSCAIQTELWRDNPGFANPAISLHPEGLAIDVYNTSSYNNSRSRAALVKCGWHFGVSGEPWHASFQVVG